ncbi:hypothetical protein E2C01_055151 [Portunus trituberculatus]|uniref:Uncharacterized protein n=1 Tax=Portunus trituberculatus TaxID=210409 RepID=A0A5B7GVU7_PORTR|nr:hypothetical protein [Portunus trituberculatus]
MTPTATASGHHLDALPHARLRGASQGACDELGPLPYTAASPRHARTAHVTRAASAPGGRRGATVGLLPGVGARACTGGTAQGRPSLRRLAASNFGNVALRLWRRHSRQQTALLE